MSAAAGAQDGKMGKMNGMAHDQRYTGCIERSQDGGFTLAHAAKADGAMKKPMARDSMTTESMTKDSMAKDSMAKDPMAKDSMMTDAMALGVAGTGVDLAKHVGHKVTVTGVSGGSMNGMATFTVKSVKMVAASCS